MRDHIPFMRGSQDFDGSANEEELPTVIRPPDSSKPEISFDFWLDEDENSPDSPADEFFIEEPVKKPAIFQAENSMRRIFAFTSQHAKALSVGLVVALLLAVGVVVYRQPKSTSMSQLEPLLETVSSSPTSSSTSSSPTTQTPTAVVKVHVTGAVQSPGVVTLTEGARVIEAIEAAGGLQKDASPGELNMAAVVPDGSQITIGTKNNPGGELRTSQSSSSTNQTSGGMSQGSLVNLNTATQAELETLPQVGPVLASEIIAWRTKNGGFKSVEQLQEVKGIGEKTFKRLAPLVRV